MITILATILNHDSAWEVKEGRPTEGEDRLAHLTRDPFGTLNPKP